MSSLFSSSSYDSFIMGGGIKGGGSKGSGNKGSGSKGSGSKGGGSKINKNNTWQYKNKSDDPVLAGIIVSVCVGLCIITGLLGFFRYRHYRSQQTHYELPNFVTGANV